MGFVTRDVFTNSLYKKQSRQFEKINESATAFIANYCGNTIIRDSIFGIVDNYARKKELSLEVLRYPFRDDELWAFTFVKKGTVFLCVNSDLPMCKQIFATAHELYHIQCYVEDTDTSTITSGSILDSKTFDEMTATQEDLEANAFAGVLLMPDGSLAEQFKIFGISRDKVSMDDILTLMDLFALPYKAVVLRLAESGMVSEENVCGFLDMNAEDIAARIELTGRARKWQQNSNALFYYGSLLENMAYNSENELLTNMREESDKAYLKKIENEFKGDKVGV